MKDSFVLYTNINDVIQELSDEQKGKLFQAIIDYERTGDMPEIDDMVVKVAFIPIKRDLDYNDEKYQKTSEERAEAGRRGGLAKANNSKQTVAKGSKSKQKVAKVDFAKTDVANDSKGKQDVANVADNEYEYDNDLKDNPPISPQGERVSKKHFSENQLVQDAFNDFYEMRQKIKKPMTDRAIAGLKTSLGKLSDNPVTQAKILDQSTFKSWQGVFPLRDDFTPLRDYQDEEPKGKPPDNKLEFDEKGYPVGYLDIVKSHGAYDDGVDVYEVVHHTEWFSPEIIEWLHTQYVFE